MKAAWLVLACGMLTATAGCKDSKPATTPAVPPSRTEASTDTTDPAAQGSLEELKGARSRAIDPGINAGARGIKDEKPDAPSPPASK